MIIHDAEEHRLSHAQCIELIEQAEDSIDMLIGTIQFLVYSEKKSKIPNMELIDNWNKVKEEVFEMQFNLPGSGVDEYRRVISSCNGRNLKLSFYCKNYK